MKTRDPGAHKNADTHGSADLPAEPFHAFPPSLEEPDATPESAAPTSVVSASSLWVLGGTAVAAVAVVWLSRAAAGLTLLPTPPARGVRPTPVPHSPAGERFWVRDDVAERLEGV